MLGNLGGRRFLGPITLAILGLLGSSVEAGDRGRFSRKVPVAVPRVRPVTTSRVASGPVEPLGTFYPTPFLMVRGNGPAGGGFSPLGQFGDANMVVYGPLSSLRMTSAPVLTYTRGYDGRTVVAPGTSFSAPNYPELTPVVYPTQASNYYGFRQSGDPPWWANGINWLDQN